jgi:phenylacetate-CoA ligase
MQERYLNAFSMTEEKMKEFAETLAEWQPAMFKGYASALSLFAQYVKERVSTRIHPGYIETTSEKLSQPQRELLEEVFACRVADHYSSREMGTMAYQCDQGGFHVCADMRYLEIVADGQVVPTGQIGEVVVTSLDQYAMPFIRYKNGDMVIGSDAKCRCGRGLTLLKEVVGRTNDYLVSADGQFVHSEYFAYLFRVKPEVVRYQVYQPRKEQLEVRLICRERVSDDWIESVRSEIQARFGYTTRVSLHIVDHLELTPAGKHRYIISKVTPDFS